jgi:L-amino acid N-acyltransferase YncA
MTGGVSITAAAPADAEAIATIYRHYVLTSGVTFDDSAPGATEFAQKIGDVQRGGLPFLVAKTAGTVEGYGYCRPYKARPAYRFTVEDSVYIDHQRRGRGIGRRLLETLLADSAAAGMRQVVAVIADTGDPASVVLHQRCGFVLAGRLRSVGFKHDRWLDTILMQTELS